MKLTIITDFQEQEISIGIGTDKIYLHVTEDDSTRGAFLSAFEAQTIASALLQMAAKLEYPHDVFDEHAAIHQLMPEIDTLEREKKARLAKQDYITLNEPILSMREDERGKYISANTTGFYTSNETWERESHLQREYENNEASYMNLKKDSDGLWWLEDCLPF